MWEWIWILCSWLKKKSCEWSSTEGPWAESGPYNCAIRPVAGYIKWYISLYHSSILSLNIYIYYLSVRPPRCLFRKILALRQIQLVTPLCMFSDKLPWFKAECCSWMISFSSWVLLDLWHHTVLCCIYSIISLHRQTRQNRTPTVTVLRIISYFQLKQILHSLACVPSQTQPGSLSLTWRPENQHRTGFTFTVNNPESY